MLTCSSSDSSSTPRPLPVQTARQMASWLLKRLNCVSMIDTLLARVTEMSRVSPEPAALPPAVCNQANQWEWLQCYLLQEPL